MAREINKLKKAKFVYAFGKRTDGDASMREILGGKGANLAEMALIGLPVPPGFTLSTEVCGYFYGNTGNYPKGLENAVSKAISEVEKQQNKGFGDPLNPLLFTNIKSLDFKSNTFTNNCFLSGKSISNIVLLNNSCILGLYIIIKSLFFLINFSLSFVRNFKTNEYLLNK